MPSDPAVNTGKPSLKRRLEDYYSLVQPEAIQNDAEWRKRFEQIYEKFGGSVDGERRLQRKLAKKYGRAMSLQIVEESKDEGKQGSRQMPSAQSSKSEDWYQLKADERKGGLDMLSNAFDPVAALQADNMNTLLKTNHWLSTEGKILDRVDQFYNLLPRDDPLYRPPTQRTQPLKPSSQDKKVSVKKSTCVFAGIAQDLQEGPYAFLHRAFSGRQRVRIVLRYVNHIRGTLTGHLVAYDKHYNMILRDAEEVYTPRVCTASEGAENTKSELSNVELELLRRQQRLPGTDWGVRQRHLPQIMIRGDNVVSVHLPREERSAWPDTSKSPAVSQYRSLSTRVVLPEQRVGTPGALLFTKNQGKPYSECRGKSDYKNY